MVVMNHITSCRENCIINFPELLRSFSTREIKPFLNYSEFIESEHGSNNKFIWWPVVQVDEMKWLHVFNIVPLWICVGLAVLMHRSRTLTTFSNFLGQNWAYTYAWLLIFSSFSAANSLIQPSVLHGLFAAVDRVMPIFSIFGQWIRAVCHDT